MVARVTTTATALDHAGHVLVVVVVVGELVRVLLWWVVVGRRSDPLLFFRSLHSAAASMMESLRAAAIVNKFFVLCFSFFLFALGVDREDVWFSRFPITVRKWPRLPKLGRDLLFRSGASLFETSSPAPR